MFPSIMYDTVPISPGTCKTIYFRSSSPLILQYIIQSSPKRRILDLIMTQMSFTQSKHSNGPKTLPWGTHDDTLHLYNSVSPTVTLFLKISCILSNPIPSSFFYQLVMWHLVKILWEVDYDCIHFTSLVKKVRNMLEKEIVWLPHE